MHSVTKFLVLFMAVLSILLSGMVIAFSANADRIIQDYGNAQASEKAAQAAFSAGSAQWTSDRANIMGELEKLKSQLQQKDTQLAELELERATLRNERTEAQRARDSFKARVDDFAEIIKTNQTMIDRYSQEVTELRRNELAFRTQKLETEERLTNLLSQVDVLQANNRALAEQMFELRAKVAGGGAATANAGTIEPFNATHQITGRIENVQTDKASGKILVQLNVGSNTGVSNGMTFRVVRGSEFIANVVVRRTDLAFSVAEVEILQKDIQVGDDVRTKL